MRVAVFGLGEAGSLIAGDLAAAGATVSAYDPADVATPEGVRRHGDPGEAVVDAELVLAITAASDALTAMEQAWDAIGPPTAYADLSTCAVTLAEEMAGIAAAEGVLFSDVALMSPVPGRGLATPSLASGSGAGQFAESINRMGGQVEAIGEVAGLASARKLMRSVVTKGLAGLLIESLEAAGVRDDRDWLWAHLVEELSHLDEDMLRRLLAGTGTHAERRLKEMEAARELLIDLGIDPTMTRATVEILGRVHRRGMPGTRTS
jgi:3-hydroxyisobutyrate dehydrogenase-like beta-hydroxyacid dehydrogenase